MCDLLTTATNLIEQDYSEVADERDAFKELHNRTVEIEPEQPANAPVPSARLTEHSPTNTKIDQICTVYRETVMDVPHYDEVYEESFVERLTREFGPEIAAQIDHTGTPFTKSFKTVFQEQIEHAIHGRQQLLTIHTGESQSINEAKDFLETLFAQLDTTITPGWYCEDFISELEAVAEERQKTLQNRSLESPVSRNMPYVPTFTLSNLGRIQY